MSKLSMKKKVLKRDKSMHPGTLSHKMLDASLSLPTPGINEGSSTDRSQAGSPLELSNKGHKKPITKKKSKKKNIIKPSEKYNSDLTDQKDVQVAFYEPLPLKDYENMVEIESDDGTIY